MRGYQIDYQPEHNILLAGDAGPDQSLHPLSAMIRPFQSDRMPFDQLPDKIADIFGNQGFRFRQDDSRLIIRSDNGRVADLAFFVLFAAYLV